MTGVQTCALPIFTYLVAAVMSSFGITSMAIMAVYYRFSWQMEVCFLSFHTFYFYFLFYSLTKFWNWVVFYFKGGEVPLSEMFGTFALSVGAAVSSISFIHFFLYNRIWSMIWVLNRKLGRFLFSGRHGVLGSMGSSSSLARFFMAYARGIYFLLSFSFFSFLCKGLRSWEIELSRKR